MTPAIRQVAWVHDEVQLDHKPGLGPYIAKVSQEAMEAAGRILNFRGRLRTDAKTGKSWAECH